MKIYRKYLVKYCENKKDVFDNRKKFAEAIFSYFDDQGNEYRKKFQLPAYSPENEYWNIAPKELTIIGKK